MKGEDLLLSGDGTSGYKTSLNDWSLSYAVPKCRSGQAVLEQFMSLVTCIEMVCCHRLPSFRPAV